MQILKLTIENVRAVDSIELDLTAPSGRPRRRAVLLAANGFGKTTTLDAIAHLFGTLDERLGAKLLGEWDRRRATQASPAPGSGEGPPAALVEIEAALAPEERAAIRAYHPTAPASGIIRREIARAGPALTIFDPASFWETKESAFADPVRAALVEAHGAPCVYLTVNRGALTASSDVSAADLVDFDPRAGALSPGRDRFRSLAARLALAYAAPRDFDRDGLARRLWLVLAEHLPRMPRPVGVRGLTLLFDNQRGAQVDLSELSDGERAVLLLLGEIALRNPEHGVVLIDELEQHLHPRWQREVLDAMVALVPTAQFIVTTQSVSLAASAPDDLLKLGDWDEHGA